MKTTLSGPDGIRLILDPSSGFQLHNFNLYRRNETMTKLAPCPVTIFEGGGVNLDAEDADDLLAFWVWVARDPRALPEAARAIFPDRQPGYVRATSDLLAYAANKATAMTCRSRGDMDAAGAYEAICDRIYDSLPTWATW